MVIIVIAYLAFYYFSGGSLTEQEKQFKRLEKEFNAALSQYQQYIRMAAASGMDITFEVGDIGSQVQELKRELTEFKEQLTDEPLLKEAEILGNRMDKFISEIRY